MLNFHDWEIFTFEIRTFSVIHTLSMTAHCQLHHMWLMMTGYYYLLFFTQGCRDILIVLGLLPATDPPPRKWVTRVCLPRKYLLSLCCVEISDVRCLCCAGVGGPSPESLSSLAEEEGLGSCCPRHRCWTEEFWGTIFLRNGAGDPHLLYSYRFSFSNMIC